MQGLTTLHLFRLKPGNLLWGLSRMQRALPVLKRTAGLRFFKLMGSGAGNGFSARPDLRVFALLCVWDSEQSAQEAMHGHPLWKQYADRSREQLCIRLQALRSHGSWGGVQPFPAQSGSEELPGPLAVMTRARIRPSKIFRFWKFVPRVSQLLGQQPGLRFSIGVGEWPWFYQATFSIWESQEHLAAFAYAQGKLHAEVVRLTRREAWYSEDMFARFQVLSLDGTWNGITWKEPTPAP